ncbi:MAG: hypothetical protein M5U34_46665 [Chloroflexi bacterium]|nr:hypothetical protein [Chloroflexota bacterium]
MFEMLTGKRQFAADTPAKQDDGTCLNSSSNILQYNAKLPTGNASSKSLAKPCLKTPSQCDSAGELAHELTPSDKSVSISSPVGGQNHGKQQPSKKNETGDTIHVGWA